VTHRAIKEPTFLILTVLAADSRHGYGIIKDVERLSSGRVRLRPGTLYRALDRLRADGLVWVDREEIVRSRLRRYYGLTPKGERRLADEAARFCSDAAVALVRLGRSTGDPVHRAAQRRREVRGQSHLNGPLTWQGSTLVAGDLAEGVTALKERHDEVHVIGSLDLLQSLLRLRLVDRMNLWLYPLLLGSGKQVFAEGTVPALATPPWRLAGA
jgi:DNA-binding PadR family transcriptional regulator